MKATYGQYPSSNPDYFVSSKRRRNNPPVSIMGETCYTITYHITSTLEVKVKTWELHTHRSNCNIYKHQSTNKKGPWDTGFKDSRLYSNSKKNLSVGKQQTTQGLYCSTSLNCYLQVPGHPWLPSRAYGPLPTTPAW